MKKKPAASNLSLAVTTTLSRSTSYCMSPISITRHRPGPGSNAKVLPYSDGFVSYIFQARSGDVNSQSFCHCIFLWSGSTTQLCLSTQTAIMHLSSFGLVTLLGLSIVQALPAEGDDDDRRRGTLLLNLVEAVENEQLF
jgi:hypothetical protein